MSNAQVIETFDAGGTIAPFRMVKHGADDDSVVQAAAVSDKILGVSNLLGADSGDRPDVITFGHAQIELGGTVGRGDELTADANGKGVNSAPSAGVNNWILGRARVSGVAGDIIPVFVNPQIKQG